MSASEFGNNNTILQDDWELMGERIQLTSEVAAQVMARQNTLRYATIDSVSLASFARDVRQV